jgi:hypothetical protein
LPVVLYGCEAWSLKLREERRLKVFENRVLRVVFGPKRDEVTGECRKLHNEELIDLYSLINIVRVVKSRMRWAGHVARMVEGRGVHRVLVGGFGGLEVACWPLVSKEAGSNPAEAVGFFRAKKSSARLPSEGK